MIGAKVFQVLSQALRTIPYFQENDIRLYSYVSKDCLFPVVQMKEMTAFNTHPWDFKQGSLTLALSIFSRYSGLEEIYLLTEAFQRGLEASAFILPGIEGAPGGTALFHLQDHSLRTLEDGLTRESCHRYRVRVCLA